MQLLLFGYAINTDVRHIPTVVYDQDAAPRRAISCAACVATGFYDVVGDVAATRRSKRRCAPGEARVALVMPPRYASDLARGRPAQVQLVVDGSDPQTVASATNTAAGLLRRALRRAARSRARAARRLPRRRRRSASSPSTWYNPELRTAVFVVPGLVGVILTMTMVMLTAMAIARERERGTLEQLIVSPVGRVELMHRQDRALRRHRLRADDADPAASGAVVFDVPIVGLAARCSTRWRCCSSPRTSRSGLFFSTLAKTQQQAMQMSFFFLLPNILLSGFMFPFEAMPRPAQLLAQALPLTHFLRIVRGIVLKGRGFADLGGELVWLGGDPGRARRCSRPLRFQKKVV